MYKSLKEKKSEHLSLDPSGASGLLERAKARNYGQFWGGHWGLWPRPPAQWAPSNEKMKKGDGKKNKQFWAPIPNQLLWIAEAPLPSWIRSGGWGGGRGGNFFEYIRINLRCFFSMASAPTTTTLVTKIWPLPKQPGGGGQSSASSLKYKYIHIKSIALNVWLQENYRWTLQGFTDKPVSI